MPMLTNHRHELFARALAEGMGVGKAYRSAGYRPSPQRASALKARPEVKARVAEYISGRAQTRRDARAEALERADTLYRLAMEKADLGSALKALEAIILLEGLSGKSGGSATARPSAPRSLREFTTAELQALLDDADRTGIQ